MGVITEIEDMETGCTYIREGETVQECIADFQCMFFREKDFKVLWIEGKR